MSKSEVIEKIMNSENASVFVGITGIVALVSLDLITKRSYKMDAQKDKIALAPGGTGNMQELKEQENKQ